MCALLTRKKLLSERQEELRELEQELFSRLSTALNRFGPDISPEDKKHFQQARDQLDGFFLLVVAGEFNSGKSSFLNALLGQRVLPEGVTPTTDRIHLLKYGDEPTQEQIEEYLMIRTFPSEVLREIHIVDTPGTNAVLRRHEELTRDFIPRCDLVFFITSADRPFTESERLFLQHVKQWGKKIIFVLNKIDILTDPKERDEVIAFVKEHAYSAIGTAPKVFPVSSRVALEARIRNDDELWTSSGFEAVETYLLETLDQEERIRLKLLNPLELGLRLASIYKEEAFQRLKTLSADITAIQNIESQLQMYHKEMLRDFQPRLAALDGLLQEMNIRGLEFFDEQIRIGKFQNLLRHNKIKNAFEKDVIKDTPAKMDEEINRLVDWIASSSIRLWEDINHYIDRRQLSKYGDQIIGDRGSAFHYNRQAIFESVRRVSEEVLERYHRDSHSSILANEVRDTFATTALAELGAVGVGTVVVLLAQTALADFTGILAASLIGLGGFYLIPAKRKQAKRNFQKRIADLRKQLSNVLTKQIHREVSDSADKIQEAIGPYRRFVFSQQEQLSEAQDELVTLENSLLRLKSEIARHK